MKRHVLRSVILAFLSIFFLLFHHQAMADDPIGRALDFQGQAKVLESGKLDYKEVKKGDPIEMENAYLTEEDSKLLLKFDDDSYHSLGRDSSVYINDFGEEGPATFYHGHVAKGYIRFIKDFQKTRPPSGYVVTTPTSVIVLKPHKDRADFIVQVHNDYQTDVTVLFGKLTVENILDDLEEKRTLRSCQRVFIDAGKDPSKVYGVSAKTMERLIERTTIKGTLPEDIPECKKPEKECPCPWGFGQDADGSCKPCAFYAGALYDPDKCECVCPCPPGSFPNPINGQCLPACPTQAPVLKSTLPTPDPNVLPHHGCGYCSCCESGSGCYLSIWGDPSCSNPACGHCGPPIAIWPPVITPPDPFGLYPCAKCCDCDLMLPVIGGPCGLNAAAFPTAGSCGPTSKCISRAQCIANGGYFVRTEWRVFARPCWVCQRDKPIVAYKAMAAGGGSCGPCEKLTYKSGKPECEPVKEGVPCFTKEAECGECVDGECEKLKPCPEGKKYDSKCECVEKPESEKPGPEEVSPPTQEPEPEPECESNSECSKETAGKKPCCRQGECAKYQRCSDGKYRCECDQEYEEPREPPSTPPPSRPSSCGKCEQRVSGMCVECWRLDKKCYKGKCVNKLPSCGRCQVRRGDNCYHCEQLGLECNRYGKCRRPRPGCGPCEEMRKGRCYSCARLGKSCANGRCVDKPKPVTCGPCQVKRGNSCVSCQQLGMKCVKGRCVRPDGPSGGQTRTPGASTPSGPGIEITPGGSIKVDPNQLRKFIQ